MNKSFFFISAVFFCTSTFLFSQSSFVLYDPDNGNAVVNNSVIDIWMDDSMSSFKAIDVENTSSSSKTVKCVRTFVSGVNTIGPNKDSLYFGWGGVHFTVSFNQSQAFNYNNMPANFKADMINFRGFFADMSPCSLPGTRTVRFCFYDNANFADSVNVTINYHVTGVGINEKTSKEYFLSEPVPNPACTTAAISYFFPADKRSTLEIYSSEGKLMSTINLKNREGKIEINTSDFPAGIYYCNLLTDNTSAASRKLIVVK